MTHPSISILRSHESTINRQSAIVAACINDVAEAVGANDQMIETVLRERARDETQEGAALRATLQAKVAAIRSAEPLAELCAGLGEQVAELHRENIDLCRAHVRGKIAPLFGDLSERVLPLSKEVIEETEFQDSHRCSGPLATFRRLGRCASAVSPENPATLAIKSFENCARIHAEVKTHSEKLRSRLRNAAAR